MNAPATVPLSRIADIVGATNVITEPSALAAYTVDGLAPQIAARPASAQEVSELVKFAAAEKLAVIPTGARTKLGVGMPPSRYDLAIDMTRLDRVISYDPGDLTLSVEPGIPLSRLAQVLAEHNQFLPLAVPFYDRATVGGTLASGVDSPLRQAYGTARDFVLGMEFVSGDGALTKSGGRVVKNVSGYDLHKLFLGSIGSLGLITRVDFKTFPLPRASATFLASFADATAAANFNSLIQKSSLRCHSVEILSPKAAEILDAPTNGGWSVAVSIAGTDAVIARAHRDLETMARNVAPNSFRNFARLGAAAEESLYLAAREFPATAATNRAVVVKLSCLPDSIAPLCQQVTTIAEKHSIATAHVFHGVGVGYCALLSQNSAAAQLKECSQQLLALSANNSTFASIPYCPLELKRQLSVWGPPREDFILHQHVKCTFDPHNIFAPGRFVGGL
ncbi:MAG TPA: FAD-binding oxidoreductase [Candidatus Acidoferrales bacterium]|nr:FAD-binding oxidoreductase [Candidatus Acidoferrales bacterium]